MLFLDNDAVAELIDPARVVAAQDEAYRDFGGGTGVCPPRIDVQSGAGEAGRHFQLGLAAGIGARYAALRIKADVVFEEMRDGRRRKNKFCGRPGQYCGLVLLFERASGAPLALMHDGVMQKMRVGADSALGARYLARADAHVLGILGSGGMARAHVAAMRAVRPISRLVAYSPDPGNRARFVAEMAERHGIDAVAVDSPEAVAAQADILCSCASAVGPVIAGRFLRPGQHVTCIGGTLDAEADARIDLALRFGLAPAPVEIPGARVEDECLSFVEGGEKSASGGTRRYARIPAGRRVSLAELLADPARGRRDAEQVTFSERGNVHGIQFAAVAGLLYEAARDARAGRPLPADLFLQTIRN
jgi:ornithine cyclodeaminase/alanine dehydrogenase-like protein (mu-crystallin family)